jgi:hypothetical protein
VHHFGKLHQKQTRYPLGYDRYTGTVWTGEILPPLNPDAHFKMEGWQKTVVKLWKCVKYSQLENFELRLLWWFGHVTYPLEWPFHHMHPCQVEEDRTA